MCINVALVRRCIDGVPVVSLQYNHAPLQPSGDVTKSRSLDRKHVEPIVLTKWRHSAYFPDPNDKVRKKCFSPFCSLARLFFMSCASTCGKMLPESRLSVVDWFALQRLIKTRRFRAASARLHPYKHQVSSSPGRPISAPSLNPSSQSACLLEITEPSSSL